MRISDWSSDVCSSDLPISASSGRAVCDPARRPSTRDRRAELLDQPLSRRARGRLDRLRSAAHQAREEGREGADQRRIAPAASALSRSEEHTSELQSLMRISYAVFCLKKKKNTTSIHHAYVQHAQKHHRTTPYRPRRQLQRLLVTD